MFQPHHQHIYSHVEKYANEAETSLELFQAVAVFCFSFISQTVRRALLTVKNLVKDGDADFFSRVLRNKNHVLHPICCRNETTTVMYCDVDAMSVLLRATMTNAISYTDRQLHKYRATNFSTSPLCIV